MEEAIIILLLILVNGLLSLSEISLISSSQSRLHIFSKGKAKKSAKRALLLKEKPDTYLSTIQVGITIIGIFTGIYSGDTLVLHFKKWLESYHIIHPYAGVIAKTGVVIGITYITIVFGELLPKKIGMYFPETLLRQLSGFLNFVHKLVFPFAWILTYSLKLLEKLFRLSSLEKTKITEEEILATIQRGATEGAVEDVEHDIVERVFDLGDRNVGSVMTHRNDLVCIDISASPQEISQIIYNDMHAYYPVINQHIDNLIGVISLKDLFGYAFSQTRDIRSLVSKPEYYPETISTYKVLKSFRESELYYGLIINEFGSLQGMITSADIMEAVLGRMSQPDETEETIIKQSENSWLVDGQYSFYDFLSYFDMEDIFQQNDYNTLSGLILEIANHVPMEGETVHWEEFEFKIFKMDSARIDKVLVCRLKPPTKELENN
jgi:putative hemolysin